MRALLIQLVEAGGILERSGSGLDRLSKEQRDYLRKLRVRVGALDLFAPDMLKPAALAAWRTLRAARGASLAAPMPGMPPVIGLPAAAALPPGYRRLGTQALRLDLAEKLLRAAHDARVAAKGKTFVIDPALAISTGLATPAYALLLRLGGFKSLMPRPLHARQFGPAAPPRWRWQPARREDNAPPPAAPAPRTGNVFAELLR